MKRFQGLINRSKSVSVGGHGHHHRNSTLHFDNAPADSPEANASLAIRLFCESGSNSNGGEEVLHLPVIVEAAESSPTAAAAAAHQIKKFLGKEWSPKPHVQYNAIMLVRILSDNPGPTFTRNFDKSFVGAVKELLRNCRDSSTQQILRETLDSLEADKAYDDGLQLLFQMWRKEKGSSASLSHARSVRQSQQFQQPPQQQQHIPTESRSVRSDRNGTTLPSPAELASRVEEAKNTAKILLQFVQTTPPGEVLHNELLREFSERCQSAQRSMQSYINCDNPPPDHDTMQTLIETNEQLSLAMSRHQRAILAARRALGPPSPNNGPLTETGLGAPTEASSVYSSQRPSNYTYSGTPRDSMQARDSMHDGQQFQGYNAPLGPPPGIISSFNQRSTSPPSSYQQQQPSNPFTDPVGHNHNPAPLAIEPTHYGTFGSQPEPRSFQPPLQPHRPQTVDFQTFNIEPEPIFSPPKRQNTMDLENAYSDSEGRVSPIATRYHQPGPPSEGFVSPSSPRRPGPGAWHNSEITPSYMGRQESAANGLTMHGAVSDDHVAEIDGHSQIGRRDRARDAQSAHSGAGAFGSSQYDVSPIEVKTAQQATRVDVPSRRF